MQDQPLNPASPQPAGSDADDPGAGILEQIACGWMAQALRAAVELGVAEHLAAGPQTADDLARATRCHGPALRRLLRALVTIKICNETTPDVFALTARGEYLRADHPNSLRAWTLWWGTHLWPLWTELPYSVRTGASARAKLLGTQGFAHLAQDPQAAAIFHQALTELARLVAQRLVANWDFSAARHVVDIGGGHGELIAAVLRAYPILRGTVLEQAHALAGAHEHLRAQGVLDRCAVAEGDFFVHVPAHGDVYLLKSVLHDWDDTDAARILARCHQAMSATDRLLVIERVLPQRPAPTPEQRELARSDLTMLLAHGARERTEQDFRALLASAGLRIMRVMPIGMTMSVLEAARA